MLLKKEAFVLLLSCYFPTLLE